MVIKLCAKEPHMNMHGDILYPDLFFEKVALFFERHKKCHFGRRSNHYKMMNTHIPVTSLGSTATSGIS